MESCRVKMLEFYQFGLHESPLGPFDISWGHFMHVVESNSASKDL